MVEYPKVTHKIPELFEIIIDTDRYRELLRKRNIIPLDDIRENKLRRQELTRAAKEFLAKKGGGNKGAL